MSGPSLSRLRVLHFTILRFPSCKFHRVFFDPAFFGVPFSVAACVIGINVRSLFRPFVL